MPDLFDPSRGALTTAERKRLAGRHARKPKGHAWKPGSGPMGETCGSCAHRVRLVGHRKTYQKCGLMRAHWTHGPGSDIRCCDPACREWKGGE